MTAGNFNWFLHTMLFYHTQRVIQRQTKGAEKNTDEEGDEQEEEDVESDNGE